LAELIKVLAPHPGGLRRWSVMRGIRKDRESAVRDIPQKFEDDVERTLPRKTRSFIGLKRGPVKYGPSFPIAPRRGSMPSLPKALILLNAS